MYPKIIFTAYRIFQAWIIAPLMVLHRSPPFCQESNPKVKTEMKRTRVWFHAASAGELESLWPLVHICVEEKLWDCVLTIFSPSAWKDLEMKLKQTPHLRERLLFWGYSPWEGRWRQALKKYQPDLFVSVRYESWPDLWVSLFEEKIPLVLLLARDRSSLRLAVSICEWVCGALPELIFFANTKKEQVQLQELFHKNVLIELCADPRWDQVWSRATKKNPHLENLLSILRDLLGDLSNKKQAVLGSIWLEDILFLNILFEKLISASQQLPNVRTIVWVVPHCVDESNIQKIKKQLDKNYSALTLRTGELLKSKNKLRGSVSPLIFLLVDQKGILSELYAHADWVWIGGGFGAGVHSTLEPAIHGVPIACGPKNASLFSDLTELSSRGQLKLIDKPDELLLWADQFIFKQFSNKKLWQESLENKRSSSLRLVHWFEQYLQLPQ